MRAFLALLQLLQSLGKWLRQWQRQQQLNSRIKLESDAAAYEKLAKAINARNKNRLSRRNNTARGRPPDERLPNNRYRRK